MKVGFDFDGTLSEPEVQKFAKELVNSGLEVWIITARIDNETSKKNGWYWIEKQNKQLFDIANGCGIKPENIKFTSMCDKIEFIEGNEFTFHLDDDDYEIDLINSSNDKCKGVWMLDKNWKEKCLKLIK
jgi:hypothetical protein